MLFKLVPQVYRTARIAEAARETVLNSSERAGGYLLERFSGETAGGPLRAVPGPEGKAAGLQAPGRGRRLHADLDIRKMVENALLTSASAVILAHNHPSGVALPSPEDYATTDRVKEALETVGLPAWWTISWWPTGDLCLHGGLGAACR